MIWGNLAFSLHRKTSLCVQDDGRRFGSGRPRKGHEIGGSSPTHPAHFYKEEIMRFRRNRNEEGVLVESLDVNKVMNKKPKKRVSFSFGIGYAINGRRNDIFAVEISTT